MRGEPQSIIMCDLCDGTGRTPAELSKDTCPVCNGKGYIELL